MLNSRLIATSLVLLALGVAGCSGGDDPTVVFTAADARRLAQIAPVTPGWPDWPERPEKKEPSELSLDEAIARDPIFAEYHRRTSKLAGDLDAGAREIGGRTRTSWRISASGRTPTRQMHMSLSKPATTSRSATGRCTET